jgi:hypothetical protein
VLLCKDYVLLLLRRRGLVLQQLGTTSGKLNNTVRCRHRKCIHVLLVTVCSKGRLLACSSLAQQPVCRTRDSKPGAW